MQCPTHHSTHHTKQVSYGLSHIGKVRLQNEDAYLDLAPQGLWAVADGLGGHQQGDVASAMIVQALNEFQQQIDMNSSVQWLVKSLQNVNQELVKLRHSEKHSLIASTVCVLCLHEDDQGQHCVCLWSGDSRIYRYRNQKLSLLTQDHNRVQTFIDAGFPIDEVHTYPLAQQLTKAVGAKPTWEYEVQYFDYQMDDIFLLCSDGLSNELSEWDMTQALSAKPFQQLGDYLLAKVLTGAAKDNITLVLVKV